MTKLIVEMDMPKNCEDCLLCETVYVDFEYCKLYCLAKDREEIEIITEGVPTWCPIKGVLPDEHGDLVDYDEVEKEFNRLLTYMEEVPDENGVIWFKRETIMPRGYTMKFHTIIPAERKKDE